jgi:hypothetical protein
MHQVIVSLTRVFPEDPKIDRVRPFRWVSASGDTLDEILEKLSKQSIKDMNTSEAETADISRLVRKVFDRQGKFYQVRFNSAELIDVQIRDESDIAARQAEVDQLMFGIK